MLHRRGDPQGEGGALNVEVGVMGEETRHRLMGVDDRGGAGARGRGEHTCRGTGHQIAAEDQVGMAPGDADGGNRLGRSADLEMGDDRTVLL